MILKREDLLAAASAGILQYKQVDTMLVFLRHREAIHQREDQQTHKRSSGKQVFLALLAILAIAAAGLLTAMNLGYVPSNLQLAGLGGFAGLNADNLKWFVGLYALFTLLVTVWTERSRINGAARVLITMLIAMVPLAIVASQYYRFM